MSDFKPKVLFLSSWYPSRVHATLGNFVQKHAQAAALFSDVRVLYVCFEEGKTDNKPGLISQNINGITEVIIYLKKRKSPLARMAAYIGAYKTGLAYLSYQDYRPDILHTNVAYPLAWLFFLSTGFGRIPRVHTEHWAGYLPEYPEKPGFLKKWIVGYMLRRAKRFLPVTADLGEAMKEQRLCKSYQVVPNVVDTKLFQPAVHHQKNKFRFLHISSLDPEQKNVAGIIRVCGQLLKQRSDFELHIVGDGPKEQLEQQANELGLLNQSVWFHSTMGTAEIAAMVQQSDALVLFSNYENLPCVIVEAFAGGIPVISTNVGGIAEYFTADHGLMIAPGDEPALLESMQTMLDNRGKYDAVFLHQYAVEHFSYETIGRQFESCYREILSKK